MTAIPHRAGFFYSLLLMLLLYTTPISAQDRQASTFTGKVTDARTGEPIPGASVYIAGSTSGSSTDSTGVFNFETQITGNHQIVFSLIGYKTKPKALEISANESYRINASLESVTIQMQEVEVVSSNKEWKESFEYFRSQFIGSTDYAEETKITNPWVLNFEKSDNTLLATADKPLIVLNQAMGYKITIELVQFQWNTDSDLGIYRVYSLFEKLKPNNEEEHRKWLSNRVESYHGSQAHFLRSLYLGEWRENNFSITHKSNLYPLSDEELNYYFVTGKSTIKKPAEGWEAFKLEQLVTVRYKKRLVYRIAGKRLTSRIKKEAGLKSNREDKIFIINRWGLLKEVASVQCFGEWGRSRIADSLPNNYTFALGN